MVRLLMFAGIVGLLTLSASPTDISCAWAGRVYTDADLKVNGRMCQICQAGKWVDKDVTCEKCKPGSKPVASNPPPSDKDCTAQLEPSSPQKLTFTDGARVEQAHGKFQVCSAGIWVEKQPAESQLCPAR
jgi:hypothetical protein